MGTATKTILASYAAIGALAICVVNSEAWFGVSDLKLMGWLLMGVGALSAVGQVVAAIALDQATKGKK